MAQRILVVEDDRRIADVVAKNLEAGGYACHLSYDGGQALADFERLNPDLVILDLGLPGSTASRSCAGCGATARCRSWCSPRAAARATS